jgi:hypothetical protein
VTNALRAVIVKRCHDLSVEQLDPGVRPALTFYRAWTINCGAHGRAIPADRIPSDGVRQPLDKRGNVPIKKPDAPRGKLDFP